MLVNVWTAVTFVSFFFALKYLAPASVGAIEIGAAVLVAVIAAGMRTRAWPRWPRLVVCVGIVGGCAVLATTELAGTLSNADLMLCGLALGASALAGVASVVMATTVKQLAQDGWSSVSILTVMICMAFQPVMSFAFSLSPSYDWSNAALMGILVVTASLSLDIYVQRRAQVRVRPRLRSTARAV